jgi:hypothetical protein
MGTIVKFDNDIINMKVIMAKKSWLEETEINKKYDAYWFSRSIV